MKQHIILYDKNLSLCGDNPDGNSTKHATDKSLFIDTYKWVENTYQPKVEVYLCHNNTLLAIKFVVHECDIRTVEKEDGGKIWCDSCVEFFFRPYSDDSRYLNFEINSLGATIMSLGKDRYNRTELITKFKQKLNIITNIEHYFWSVRLEIPFSIICEVFDNKHLLKSGDTTFGNFYKCGDETAFPHFGMWNEVAQDAPDFHLSDFFGLLILG